MKKKLIVAIEILIIISLLSLISSKFLSFYKMKPFITFKTNTYTYYDGEVIEYISLFHKVTHYDRESMQLWTLTSIFKKHDNGQNNFEIIYESEICSDIGKEFYRSESYVYSLPCYGEDTVIIKFEDGETMSLKEAANSGKVTILALRKKGLLMDRQPIK